MVGIYTRQSLDKKDSISIEIQVEKCLTKFDPNEEEYKVYTDKGYSGKNLNRPDFENLMSDIEQGLIHKVVVYKVDRISRSVLDFSGIIKVFEKHNTIFISFGENQFDTSQPMGMAMLQIIMVFAELERKQIQQRVTDNYYSRGEKGFFLGGPTAFGFIKEKTKLDGIKTSTFIEDPDAMPVVIEMYEKYGCSGMSLGKISDWLNNEKIPAAKGGMWDSCKVSRILRSPMYVKADADIYDYYRNKGCIISNDIGDFIGENGCYLYGKREANERKYTRVDKHVLSIGLHRGVVDSHTWLLVQYKLDSNRQIKNSGQGKHSWLSGIAKCGYCGYAVSVVNAGHGDNKYWNCRGKTNLKVCKGHSRPIIVSAVEEKVKNELVIMIEKLKGTNIASRNDDGVKVNQIKLQIMVIENQIANLVNEVAEGNVVVKKYLNDKIYSLDASKKALLDEMGKNTLSESQKIPVEDIINRFEEWDNLDIEARKIVCGQLIEKVSITDDNVHIVWKF